MSNRYNFSNENKKIEIPLTSQVESGQIWRNKKSRLYIAIDGVAVGGGSGPIPRVWRVHTTTMGNAINTQISEPRLLLEYERQE